MSTPNAHHSTATTRSALLRQRTQAFCKAFLDLPNNPPAKILKDHFTSASTPKITEHGPAWATKRLPFLGKTFAGEDACSEYFDLMGGTLEFMPNEKTFPPKEEFIVDEKAVVDGKDGGSGLGWDGRGVVSVVGKATFKAVATGRSWDEEFIYRLSEFDEDGGIGHWEIWADPLSAWFAVGDEEVRR